MRRKSRDSGKANITGKLSIDVVEFYNPGVAQAIIGICE